MRERRRLWINKNPGPDEESVAKALLWLMETVDKGQFGIVALTQKDSLEGYIEELLGESNVKALRGGNPISSERGGQIRLMTPRIKPPLCRQAVAVAAFYLPAEQLDFIDQEVPNADIVVVPWILEEILPWRKAWGAHEFESSGDAATAVPAIKNPVVLEALKALTGSVNLSTGLSHPSDKKKAKELFGLLRAAGETYDLDEVRAWLVGVGRWRTNYANDVIKVANQKSVCKRPTVWANDILEQWRASAKTNR